MPPLVQPTHEPQNPKVTQMNKALSILQTAVWCMLVPTGAVAAPQNGYPIVDTGQDQCYDDKDLIAPPAQGGAFYGQDAQYQGLQPSYLDNGDGTISDLNTGLMWQKSPDFDTKRSWSAAATYANGLSLAGHNDWRLPTVKELYSLMDFRGSSTATPRKPYIDTTYFDFEYPDITLCRSDREAKRATTTLASQPACPKGQCDDGGPV